MQAPVPLVFEFQANGRIELTVLATGLHQSNLTTTVDSVTVNGVDFPPTKVGGSNASLVAAVAAAVQAWVVDQKGVPA